MPSLATLAVAVHWHTAREFQRRHDHFSDFDFFSRILFNSILSASCVKTFRRLFIIIEDPI